MRSVAYFTKRKIQKIHIMQKTRRNRSIVWTVKRKSPLLCGIRYRICGVRYILIREFTHSSNFCARTVILRAEVHIAQNYAQNPCPGSVWLSSFAFCGRASRCPFCQRL